MARAQPPDDAVERRVIGVLGACTCHKTYVSRDLKDPDCIYCDCRHDVRELVEEIETLKMQRVNDRLTIDSLMRRIEAASAEAAVCPPHDYVALDDKGWECRRCGHQT